MGSVVFGAGLWGIQLKRALENHYGVHVCAIITNNERKWGEKVDNVVISSPQILLDMDLEKVFICAMSESSCNEMEMQLLNMGIPKEKIVIMATSSEYADAFSVREVYDVMSLWQENRTLTKNLLSLKSRLRKYETFNEWEYIEFFVDAWEERSRFMSRYIKPECESLLDLGCGQMHIRKFLNDGTKYYGCDYKKRDEETIVCDLAKGEFPSIWVDTIFIAGLLEYLVNWRDVLRKCSQHCTQVIMSYGTKESLSPLRKKGYFVNDISYQEIVDEMLMNGFELTDKDWYDIETIFSFEKINRD